MFTKELIWSTKQDFNECHASTLLEMANGDLLCALFIGTHEGHNDVGIFWARRHNGEWGTGSYRNK